MKTLVVYSRAAEAVAAGSSFHDLMQDWPDEKRAETRVRYRNADASRLRPVSGADAVLATEEAHEEIEALYEDDEDVEVEKLKLGAGDGQKVLEDHTVDELQEIAAKLEIEGRSSMKKVELVEAITQAEPATN